MYIYKLVKKAMEINISMAKQNNRNHKKPRNSVFVKTFIVHKLAKYAVRKYMTTSTLQSPFGLDQL
jgi:hypothetical protein